jgi:hypothetical protein
MAITTVTFNYEWKGSTSEPPLIGSTGKYLSSDASLAPIYNTNEVAGFSAEIAAALIAAGRAH